MRSFLQYLWRWITVAFGHSWSVYERISGLAVVVLFVVGRFTPVPESASVMVTEIALSIFVVLFVTRMALAPYWISQEENAKSQAEQERLRQQLTDAQQKLDDREKRSEINTNIGLLLHTGKTLLDQFVVSRASDETRQKLNQWYQAVYSYLLNNLGIAQAEAFRSATPVMRALDGFPLKNGGTYQAVLGQIRFLGTLAITLSSN